MIYKTNLGYFVGFYDGQPKFMHFDQMMVKASVMYQNYPCQAFSAYSEAIVRLWEVSDDTQEKLLIKSFKHLWPVWCKELARRGYDCYNALPDGARRI